MVMTSPERAACTTAYMRELSRAASALGVTKAQLRAAIDAADQWCDDNAASFNTALPTTFRNAATAAQKNLLLTYVLRRRNGDLRIAEDG